LFKLSYTIKEKSCSSKEDRPPAQNKKFQSYKRGSDGISVELKEFICHLSLDLLATMESWLNRYNTLPSKCALCRLFEPRHQYKYGDKLKDYYNDIFFDYSESRMQSLLDEIKGKPVHSVCLGPLKYIQRKLHRHNCVCRCKKYYIDFPELDNDCDKGDLKDGYPPIHFIRVEPSHCAVCQVFQEWREENKNVEGMSDMDKVLNYMEESFSYIWWSELKNGKPMNPACSEHIKLIQDTLELNKEDPEKTSILEVEPKS